MVEDVSALGKESLLYKSPKRSPLLLRMIVLAFVMVCGVYICCTCIKQITTRSDNNMLASSCHNYGTDLSDTRYIHFPEPQTFSRAHCSCTPVRLFVILSTQRSGSGWFETLLNSHTNVSSNGEIFSVKERRVNISMIFNTLDNVYNLDWLSSASKNECSAAVGLKWMLNQGLMEHHENIVEYFNTKGVSVIFLFRRNLLRRMVSMLANSYDRYAKLLNGTHKSHVHSHEEARTLSKYKPALNLSSLVTDLKQVEMAIVQALEYFQSTRHMVVYYEDLIRNTSVLVKIQEFLRLPVMDLTSRQVKIHKGSLSEYIKNWAEVNQTLTGTPYERFLTS